MATIGEATAKERKYAMRAAVGYNLPCDVRVESNGYPVHMKSRFFALQPSPSGPRVLIEAPVQHGVIVPLRPEDQIEIFFRVDQTRYTYHSTVLGRSQFSLRGGNVARALETAYPRRMTRGQRREFFRIAMAQQETIPLTVSLLTRRGGEADGLAPISFTTRSEVINVSAGGLAFDLWEEFSRSIHTGDRLLCDLTLPAGEMVSLRGRVAVMYHMHGQRAVRFGVEFTDLDQSVDCRVSQDRLLRYVVDVQRQELAKRSGLHD